MAVSCFTDGQRVSEIQAVFCARQQPPQQQAPQVPPMNATSPSGLEPPARASRRPGIASGHPLLANPPQANPQLASRGPLLGSFEENVLNRRLEPMRTVEGFRAEVRAASGGRKPLSSQLRVSFFAAGDSFPYLGQLLIGRAGYRIPRAGSLQVTLFNPLGSVEKLFLLLYDLTDMPPNSQTLLRQRTVLGAAGSGVRLPQVRHLIQLNIVSSASGRVYLNKDLRIFVSKRVDQETAMQLSSGEQAELQLKSFNEMPNNPRYFAR